MSSVHVTDVVTSPHAYAMARRERLVRLGFVWQRPTPPKPPEPEIQVAPPPVFEPAAPVIVAPPPYPSMPPLPTGLPTARTIMRAVAEEFDLTRDDLLTITKRRDIVVPRWTAFMLMRERLPLSLHQIARHFGGMDHTTVLYGIAKVRRRMTESPDYAERVARIVSRLGSRHSVPVMVMVPVVEPSVAVLP